MMDIARESSRVLIFDTTLRDGEQSPGATLTSAEKLTLARQLGRLGVDVMEAGFPAASPDDLAAVRTIAEEVGGSSGPTIAGLARTSRRDIEAAWEAVQPAARPRIHTFIATSEIHLRHKLRMTEEQVLERVREQVGLAASLCSDVEFSAEDATRSDPGFLAEVFSAAIEAGATTLNVPDTVGYATPADYSELIAGLRRATQITERRTAAANAANAANSAAAAAAADTVIWSVHCHDDLGLAAANTLAGIAAGARQVEVTVNGIGERAGNCALEEVVMALATRADAWNATTGVEATELAETSRLTSRLTGIGVPPNKAIVGANAFAHEAGIHQDGMLKNALTYEIMTPESVGRTKSRLILGKHSGRHALGARLEELGVGVGETGLDEAFRRFKALADTQKTVGDEDLRSLAAALSEPSTQLQDSLPAVSASSRRPKTLFEKVWKRHAVCPPAEDGFPTTLAIDLHLVHEVTSPQAFAELERRGMAVRRPDKTVATMDHSTPTEPGIDLARLRVLDPEASAQLDALAENCERHGVPLFGWGHENRGIVHVIGPELGLTQPGMTVVCGDSHASTHGAFGCLAFGIGTSEVGHVLATQCLLQQKPRTMEVRVDGELGRGVTAKDLVLAIIAEIGIDGGTGHVIEYTGSAIRSLSMEGRMTVCNMSIEAGARAGMIAPDETTRDYLRGRPFAPAGEAWDAASAMWEGLVSDPGAVYDRSVSLDAATIEPMVTYGTHPGSAISIGASVPRAEDVDVEGRAAFERAVSYMGFEPGEPVAGRPVDLVFVGSCTNSRLADLEDAASLLRGRRVAPGLRMLVVPGSEKVKREAEARGLDRAFTDAGAEWREAGCSMCLAMNGDRLESGQTAVSTSNRNFEGRQGPGGRTLLASPLTAAATAIRGVLADPREFLHA